MQIQAPLLQKNQFKNHKFNNNNQIKNNKNNNLNLSKRNNQ